MSAVRAGWLGRRPARVCVCVCVFGRREMTSSFITAILQHPLHRGTHCPVHTAQPDPTRLFCRVGGVNRVGQTVERPDMFSRVCVGVVHGSICVTQSSPAHQLTAPTQPSLTQPMGHPNPCTYSCGPRGVGRAGGQLDA